MSPTLVEQTCAVNLWFNLNFNCYEVKKVSRNFSWFIKRASLSLWHTYPINLWTLMPLWQISSRDIFFSFDVKLKRCLCIVKDWMPYFVFPLTADLLLALYVVSRCWWSLKIYTYVVKDWTSKTYIVRALYKPTLWCQSCKI